MNKEIRLVIDKEFDSLNRVLNIFCGKGLEFHSLEVKDRKKEQLSEVSLKLKGGDRLLKILTKKLFNFPDIHQVYYYDNLITNKEVGN